MPVLNLNSFLAEVNAFAKNVPKEEVRKLHRAIALEGLGRIIERTPVDTGRTAGNWQVTQGTPAIGELDRVGGGAAEAAGSTAILTAPPFSITWITNNLPHIEVLEFGLFQPKNPGPSKQKRQFGETLVQGGFSTKAPEGMVRVTFEELRSIFP